MTEIRAKAQAHLVPHFTRGDAWRRDDMLVIDRGEGCYVWDVDGNEYLDGLSGLFCTNLGHGRSDLTAVAAKQMDRLAFCPTWSYTHPSTVEAATLIASAAPAGLSRVFFVNSGSEAVESALKFARCYHLANGEPSRQKVIARRWAYHGTTLGALAVTGIPNFRDPYEPLLGGFVRHVDNTLGCAGHRGPASDLPCVAAVEQAILSEGPETVAMVIAEPVQNGRGALVPPDGYWHELRRICDSHGVLLCADEVINSFGRLGHWFASERFGAKPDMITFAKGVTSAYVPLGGLVVDASLVDRVWDSPTSMFMHGATFGGHPVATAVAVANMSAMRDEGVLDGVLANEHRLAAGLAGLQESHDCVSEVRGAGFFYAVELMRDRPSGLALTDAEFAELLPGGFLESCVREARVLIRPDSRGAAMLALAPPLVADVSVIDDLLRRVDQVLDRVGGWLKASP